MTNQENSEEIRRDIAETRSELSGTIDAIQERLDPTRLRIEAKTAIQEGLTDGADSLIDYVRTHRQELSTSMVNTIKRNPLPTLLIGAGVGWLLTDMLSSSSDKEVHSPIQHYGAASRYGQQAAGYRAGYDERPYAANEANRAQYDAAGYRAGENGLDTDSDAGDGNEQMLDSAKRKASSAARSAQHTAEETGHAVQDAVGSITDSVRSAAADTAETIQAKAEQWSKETGRHISEYQQQFSEQVDRFGNSIQHQAKRSLDDNPIAFGAVALGVGALVALMLPQTRRENEWMGETSDQVMQNARGAVRDVAQHAQNVVEEVRPEVEQAAQDIADNIKRTGENSLKAVKDESEQALKKVQDKAQASVEKEAEKAQEDVKVRADETKKAVKESVES